jgi:hypothetical protein
MWGRIRVSGPVHAHVPPGVRAWLRERLRWDDRMRMMAQAAALRGGPLEMAEEVTADEPIEPAGHL